MTKASTFSDRLLWIDCTGAVIAGVLVLLLSRWLGALEGLPHEVLIFTGTANLLYGSYSFSLAVRKSAPCICSKCSLLQTLCGLWCVLVFSFNIIRLSHRLRVFIWQVKRCMWVDWRLWSGVLAKHLQRR